MDLPGGRFWVSVCYSFFFGGSFDEDLAASFESFGLAKDQRSSALEIFSHKTELVLESL